jgi:hypothetical protein
VSINRLTHDALPGAESICKSDFSETVAQRVRAMFRKLLQSEDNPASELPMLHGLGISAIPRRIAVKPQDGWDLDDSVQWIAINRATIAQFESNIAMRDDLIASSQIKRDKLHHLVLAAKHKGGNANDVLFDILSA